LIKHSVEFQRFDQIAYCTNICNPKTEKQDGKTKTQLIYTF